MWNWHLVLLALKNISETVTYLQCVRRGRWTLKCHHGLAVHRAGTPCVARPDTGSVWPGQSPAGRLAPGSPAPAEGWSPWCLHGCNRDSGCTLMHRSADRCVVSQIMFIESQYYFPNISSLIVEVRSSLKSNWNYSVCSPAFFDLVYSYQAKLVCNFSWICLEDHAADKTHPILPGNNYFNIH